MASRFQAALATCFARTYDLRNAMVGVPLVYRAHVARATVSPGQSVLDVGCGSGRVLAALAARRAATVMLSGIDISPDKVRVAAGRLSRLGDIQVAQGDATKLAYPEDSFDWVLCCLTAHHVGVQDLRVLISEAYRVLRPGGYFLLTDFGVPSSRAGRVLGRLWSWHEYTAVNLAGVVRDSVRDSPFQVLSITMSFGLIDHILAAKRSPGEATGSSAEV